VSWLPEEDGSVVSVKAKAFLSLFFCVLLVLPVSLARVSRADFSDVVPNKIQVGAYFYSWYELAYWGGTASNGCNWTYPDVQDMPVIGDYDSSNRSVIDQQLDWASDLKIDFFIMSWFGNGSLTDNVTKIFFDEASKHVTNVKLCIMIDWLSSLPYNYTFLQDYVWDNFVAPYPNIYYCFPNGHGVSCPLLCWYNQDNATDPSLLLPNLQSRFTSKTVGHKPYVDWVYHTALIDWSYYDYTQPREQCYALCPRFDDTTVFGRVGTFYRDPCYSEGFYTGDWASCLGNASLGRVCVVTICSWNEYEERSEIEPHIDRTAFTNDPYYIYNITKLNILKLKGLYSDPSVSAPWYEQPLSLFMFIMAVCLGVAIAFKKRL
jgi:hypothetical protein